MRYDGRQIQIDLIPWSQVHILFFTNTVASTSIVFSTVSTFGSMVVLTKIHRRFEPLPSLLIQIIKSFSSETVDSDDSDVDRSVSFFCFVACICAQSTSKPFNQRRFSRFRCCSNVWKEFVFDFASSLPPIEDWRSKS